jgi:hypothetical protein
VRSAVVRVVAAAVVVPAPVRAGRADRSRPRFESDSAGPGARAIFLSGRSKGFLPKVSCQRFTAKVSRLMHFAARRATNTA